MLTLRDVLEKLVRNEISIAEAEIQLRFLAVDELGDLAKIDPNRELRNGLPEIILAEGKTVSDLQEITLNMLAKRGRVIISRYSSEQLQALQVFVPSDATLQCCERAKLAILKNKTYIAKSTGGKIGIITAGTSDIADAEEAKLVAEEMGCTVFSVYDVGVAGLHRLLIPLKELLLKDVDCLVVVAGREGALASVVAGLVDVPVIAVPTSNSYGFGEKGVGTLMAMLQSCSLGLAVVNIDAGVSAGAVATLIANRAAKFRGSVGGLN
jgi:NCAIR mutase (PurE)-related protein